MSKTITLLQTGVHPPVKGLVGLMFECPPDAAIKRNFPDAIGLTELVGDIDLIKMRAAELASKMLEGEPPLRGLRQLTIFEELVIRELQYVLHVKALHDKLIAEGIKNCIFSQPSRYVEGLQWLSGRLDTSIIVSVEDSGRHASNTSRIKRIWGRLSNEGFNCSALHNEWRQIMDRLDPYHRRGFLTRSRKWERNKLWFYSTAHTFTNIGLKYEPYFPGKLEYLVENPQTGGLPLRTIGRSFISPYDFVSCSMAPTKSEIILARETILKHLKAVVLNSEDVAIRDAYLNSLGFSTFMDRLLPRGLFQTTLFERFVEQTAPAALVVGNPVFEGYALHAARKTQIPTILLQHGILGDYCQFVNPPVDRYLVRGEFWHEFLAPAARKYSHVLNPVEPIPVIENSHLPKKNTVLFLTAPYALQEFWDESDLDEILLTLLETAYARGAELVIRVHPMEQIGLYESHMQRLVSQCGKKVQITYSQGQGLDVLLQCSAVAVTFSSTVFLDCLRHCVPIISFAWHDFSFKKQIAQFGVFHFAEDLNNLRRLVEKALNKELPYYTKGIKEFMACSTEEELKTGLEKITRKKN